MERLVINLRLLLLVEFGSKCTVATYGEFGNKSKIITSGAYDEMLLLLEG